MEELIWKYLHGELSHEEEKRLSQWLAQNPEKRTDVSRLLAYIKNPEDEVSGSKRVVWEDIHFRINAAQGSPLTTRQEARPMWRRSVSIAASVLLMAGIAWWVSRPNAERSVPPVASVSFVESVALTGQKVTTILPDGTKVLLNARSKIRYPSHFSESSRQVELDGEAFFEVTHDPQRPFHVKFRGSQVTVLGTSFNIRTYEDERAVSVAVASGKVAFSSERAQSQVILDPQEMVSYDEHSEEMIKRHFDPIAVFGWKDKILYFKDDNFQKIIKELESWYGVQITTSRNFGQQEVFSGEFRNKSLENVLEGLSYLYEFTFEIKEKQVTLK
ncbi:MAG: FecR domain-containing protein [Bacteroidota bacterium]